MFAGIYYGAMYGGSTTSILLNTPGESASVMTAIEGNKMAKNGRAAQALATAAIGSFIAGTIGTLLVALFAPVARRAGGEDRRAVVLRDHAAVAGAGHRVLGTSKLRGFIGLFIGPHDRPGRARPLHRAGAAHRRHPPARRRRRHRGGRGRASSRSARRSGSPRTCAARPVDVIPVGRPFMGREDWRVRGSPGCAAPPSASRSARCRPAVRRPRRSCPTCSRRSCPSRRRTSSATARSRAWPDPRPPTTPVPPACSCRCSPSACR